MTVGTAKGRWPLLLAAAAAVVLIVGTLHETQHQLPGAGQKFWPFHGVETQEQSYGQGTLSNPLQGVPAAQAEAIQAANMQAGQYAQAVPQVQTGPPVAQQSEETFYEIALKHGTDKVTHHSYQDMYERYLPPLRHKKIKMLEIGLGCDMSYGPGASYHTWLEYFPNVDLYYLEYDAACAAEWAHKTTGATIITGDQADPVLLEKIVADYGNDFDIIVDDGGHTMVQQQTSLEHLWKAIKPGGVYFCEDLQTSYWDHFGGGATAAASGGITMMQYIFLLIEDLTYGPQRISFPGVETMVHIDCSKEVCGFFKRAAPTLNL